MGRILPGYKKAVYDEIYNSISGNTSQYYVFASNPIVNSGNTPAVNADSYSSEFASNWVLLFGKRLKTTDLLPVVLNNAWASNTVYTRYDNTQNIYSNTYYVVTTNIPGGTYDIYKCIDNANNSPSTQIPDQIQASTFTKSDGYKWRYICSVSSSNYNKFAASSYIPVTPNTTIVSGAVNYSGVDVVMISNSGSNYNAYDDGIIGSVVNTTIVQIDSTSSSDNNFYTGSAIYIYNTGSSTGQLRTITGYTSNLSGKYVTVNTALTTNNITPSVTLYKISPSVVFKTDGTAPPLAYSTVDTSVNSISSIVIIDPGYGITWANVSIQSNNSYGSGANLYAIVPPPGGHGSNPEIELNMQGYAISATFSNTEANTIPTNTTYNRIGIFKNPAKLNTNRTKGSVYSTNTFNQVYTANVSPSATFTLGEKIRGNTSGGLATVIFSNTTVLHFCGDDDFSNGEYVVSSNGTTSTQITINRIPSIYRRDLIPLYIHYISDASRSNTQNESFKIIIQV